MSGRPFSIAVRVYYQDTDAGGVVFHAQYLAFMERARTELLNQAGIDLSRLSDERGVIFMVHELAARFHQPAGLNELVSVSAEVVKWAARVSYSGSALNAGKSCWSKPM